MQLSEEFAGLSGADLSLAITCISMTFSQLDDVSSVEVSVENNLLNGKESIRLNGSRILLKDNSLAIAENTVNVYYADEQCRYLIAVEAKTKLETTAEQAAYAISLLGETPGGCCAAVHSSGKHGDLGAVHRGWPLHHRLQRGLLSEPSGIRRAERMTIFPS